MDAVQAVAGMAKAENASHVVVGIPKRLDGKSDVPGEIEKEAQAFAAELAKRDPGLTVDVEDERMSTALAKRLCEAAESRGEKVDEDSVAACVILESYILRTFPREETPWMNE
jgi:putative transcription antitermination factor YqgF